jgi:glycosyltransferase involved in cell wall biosynthesis
MLSRERREALISGESVTSSIKVSVVVPVYNPGPYLERCIRSVLEQSLPTSAFEAIFVDDGSTDASPATLDALAAARPNVRVIHQPNSGWPGRPRNVGIDAARGEYVFVLDLDDALAADALERLHAFAVRNGSDIVIGRMVGHGRRVRPWLFARSRDRVSLWNSAIVDSLTPHKLFRRAFLSDNGIRFPEGRRRLEDHVFVLEAYFAAAVISIYADSVCYHLFERGDAGNSSGDLFDPAYYYGFLREVLGVVEAHTEPGPRRDALLQRFVRIELLDRLRHARFLAHPAAYRAALFGEIRGVVAAHIPTSVDELLPPLARIQLALVRAGRLDLLVEAAEWEQSVTPVAHVTGVASSASGVAVDLAASLATVSASLGRRRPLGLTRRTARREGDAEALAIVLPPAFAAAVPEAARTVDVSKGRSSVFLRNAGDANEVDVTAASVRRTGDHRGRLAVVDHVTATVPRRLLDAPGPDDRFGAPSDLVLRLGIAGIVRDLTVAQLSTQAGGEVVVHVVAHGASDRALSQLRRLGLGLAMEASRHLDERARRQLWRRGRRLVRLLQP